MLTEPRRLAWCVTIGPSSISRHVNLTPMQYTTDIDTTTRLQSITQERDLDEFLSTAQLAGTQFTAGMRSIGL